MPQTYSQVWSLYRAGEITERDLRKRMLSDEVFRAWVKKRMAQETPKSAEAFPEIA